MTPVKQSSVAPRKRSSSRIPLYPLRLEPIHQYRVWGGVALSNLLPVSAPKDSIGEAWLLSDRAEHRSVVADGPLRGWTINRLLNEASEDLFGSQAGQFHRFPVLLKFLNARTMLSIQVHPSDEQKNCLPPDESGKSEAWVVLETGTNSRVYSGLKPGTTQKTLAKATETSSVVDHLSSFTPKPGDCLFIPAGTVHSLGGDIAVFEVQQNSDVTFRLYDWDRTDPKTGQPRELQIDKALACINYETGPCGPTEPVVETEHPFLKERLVLCEHFGLWRIRGESPFPVGTVGKARVLVLIDGIGEIEHDGNRYSLKKGNLVLLPAVVGTCHFTPDNFATVLEISLPESV